MNFPGKPIWWVVGAIALILVIASQSNDEPTATATTVAATSHSGSTGHRRAPAAGTPSTLDSDTAFASLATVFRHRYKRVTGSVIRVDDTDPDCDEKPSGGFACLMDVKLIMGVKEGWAYRVTASTEPGCWEAETVKPFGANQDSVDDYRDDGFMAPSRTEAKKLVSEGRKLRHLSGCSTVPPTSPANHATDGSALMAIYSAQNVNVKFPGKQASTRCWSTGKETVALAPDSWNFRCYTTMQSGKRYDDNVLCFKAPPYSDFSDCTSDTDYPRKARKELP